MDTSPSQTPIDILMSGRILTFCQRLFGKHNPRECWTGWKSYSWVPKNGPIPALLEGYIHANKPKHPVNITPHPCSVCVLMRSAATPCGWNHLAHNQGRQDAPPSFRESEFVDFLKLSQFCNAWHIVYWRLCITIFLNYHVSHLGLINWC